MPKWTDCTKIHEDCGGIVRWVEAVHKPGVGWTGECLYCEEQGIVVEDMLPIRGLDVEDAAEVDLQTRRELEWDESDTWRHNQKRLAEEVSG